MTASSLWTLLTNIDLSEGELLKFWLIWNAEHIHILPKGLLCILIFYAFYSSKREKKQVEVIEVARCWWHPFHCNDSRDLRFLSRSSLHMNCKTFRLPQQLYILTGKLQEASWSSVPSCLLCIGTLQTRDQGARRDSSPYGVIPAHCPVAVINHSCFLSWHIEVGNDTLNEQSWLPGKAILQDSTAN